jgi:TDG/mug DNA glycosylase family protein
MAVLHDVLTHDLRIFCGTAVAAASARRQAYYAGPGNAFWPTLFEVRLTPRLLRPDKYPVVTQYGLGLTDLAKEISGSDRALSDRHFGRSGLRAKLEQYRPGVLVFTSKRAAEEFIGQPVRYGLLEQRIGATLLFVLPSPSGAARRYWWTQPWSQLAGLASVHADA